MTPANTNRSYYPALDGLRGLAILFVVLYHNFDFIPIFQYGWAGVDIFFVLSGFLITDILLGTLGQKNYLRNFYIRRALRIFPIYYLSIILFFVIAPHFSGLAGQYAYYFPHQFFLWTNTQNWLYIFYRSPGYPLLFTPFWSVSVEEQFYLLWPVAILLLRDIKKLTAFIFVILIGCILLRIGSWLYFDATTNFFFQNFTRADGLAIGCLIALWRSDRPELLRKKLVAFFLFLLTIHLLVAAYTKIFWPSIPHFRFLGFTSISALFALLVYYGITGKGKLKKYFLENKWLIALGKISYGLYVYHSPVLILSRIYLTEKLISYGLSERNAYIFLSFSATALAILISWLSYNLFEKKILSLKNRFT